MTEPPKKKSRWRWPRRIALAILILIVLAILTPFLFTTAVARFALRHSAYAKFSPDVGSATLSLAGSLTLKNVTLHEPGAPGTPLLEAGSIRATFSWLQIPSTLRDIQADNVVLYARPGAHSPVSFLQLATSQETPPTPSPPSPTLAAAANARPFWFDHLTCTGRLNIEPFPDFAIPAATRPFQLTMTMRGSPMTPARDLALTVGDDPHAPDLLARLHFDPITGGTRLTLETLTAKNLNAGLSEAFIKSALPHWPKTLQQDLELQLASLTASATWDRVPTAPTFQAKVDLAGFAIASKPGAQKPLQLKNLVAHAIAAGPASGAFLNSGVISDSAVALDSLAAGKSTLQNFHTPITLAAGSLDASAIQATLLGGDFTGSVQFSTAEKKLGHASFTVKHLDQKRLAANLAPDRIDAEGTLSGTIDLASGQKSLLTGKIDLASDGPGRLHIKDQSTAQALAQQLQPPANTGILPANFSDIVVQQLKDYPYTSAHIRLIDHDGTPVLSLDYARNGVQPGEPGANIKTTLQGHDVLVNYTIQLPGVKLVLTGENIEDLLATASGFAQQIAGAPASK